jgi:uncharacterized protein (TIGR00299 family) protein
MKSLYFDCQAGIAGDMTVAALLDLGVPLEHLQGELAKLALPDGSYTLAATGTERGHIAALKFDVVVHDVRTHRHYSDIDTMIATSGLGDGVKERARRIFRRLAEAEAKVHGVPLAEVHFHEVGAIDSIVDIVGVAICLDHLRIDKIFVSPLPLGSGFVESEHGRLPVPAPATAELLRGLQVHGECGPGERVTPTGAAIIAALAAEAGLPAGMKIEKIGCGAGGKDFPDRPNILRAFIGSVAAVTESSQLSVMEANIDDSTPEVLGYVLERLLAEGALDTWFTPIQMKKNRPAVTLSLLCPYSELDKFSRIILAETSSIGIRHYPVSRLAVARRIEERETGLGRVRFKVTDGGAKPEFDDCRRIALEKGLPLREVYRLLATEDINR